jgi:uncharacterized membrane protein YgdD (TMEM256/DUF423 family)
MKPPLWRLLALTYGLFLLALTGSGIATGLFANADPGFSTQADGADLSSLRVNAITNRAAIDGPLAVGDHVRLADSSFSNRVLFQRQRPGDRFAFERTPPRGPKSTFIDTISPAGIASGAFWSLAAMGLVFVLTAMVIAARRPDDPLARKLVGFFFAIGTLIVGAPAPWMPVWIVVGLFLLHLFCQPFAVYAALALAVTFPRRSTAGIRRALERANVWMLLFCLAVLLGAYSRVLIALQKPPGWLQALGLAATLVYYVAIATAFVRAGRGLTGADRKRLQWVAWTLAAGFSGELVLLVLLASHVTLSEWMTWLNLTLLGIPFGLGYAIVRHRVVDIGFVVNRAIVFGSISAIVVVAFMVLEWALSSVFVRVSHITSTSLELGLALVLGFSLRTIHAKVDGFVDDLFFRDRHAAERALRTFAREVGFITDPRVAIDRCYAELMARTGASSVAIYLLDAGKARRVDRAEAAAPDAVGVDDPALVRMRASREPLALRHVESALAGDHAFPMIVRDVLAGGLVLGAKANGEAYAPDELATIEAVATALGNALDALQTAALKAEIARVLIDGAPLDVLRRTVDSASWLRGAVSS